MSTIGPFEWDPAKAAANFKKHGVRFTEAVLAFADPAALITFDDEHSEMEARQTLIGPGRRKVLLVVFTERVGNVIRIIGAPTADKDERRRYGNQSVQLR